MAYLFLGIAIICETIATLSLKASEGFTKLYPSIAVVISYAIAFFCMSIVMKSIPVGITYAIWSGVGIVLITTISYFVFKQSLDLPALIGIGLIISGVLVINFLSKSSAH